MPYPCARGLTAPRRGPPYWQSVPWGDRADPVIRAYIATPVSGSRTRRAGSKPDTFGADFPLARARRCHLLAPPSHPRNRRQPAPFSAWIQHPLYPEPPLYPGPPLPPEPPLYPGASPALCPQNLPCTQGISRTQGILCPPGIPCPRASLCLRRSLRGLAVPRLPLAVRLRTVHHLSG